MITERTKHLLNIGSNFLDTYKIPGMVCAFAGGSVGRGEADDLSDLDLNVYLDRKEDSISRDLEFCREIVQLQIQEFPSDQEIRKGPWDYRYLLEARSVYDPEAQFEEFKTSALKFFQSDEGRKRMLEAANEVVESRKAWALECIDRNEPYSAGMAGMAAWSDAAFMNGYFAHGYINTARAVDYTRELEDVFAALVEVWPLEVVDDSSKIVQKIEGVKKYRLYLREQDRDKEHFVLSDQQDILLDRKAKRLILKKDYMSLTTMLYAEAYWMVLTISKPSIEEGLDSLPGNLRSSLEELGIRKMSGIEVRELCRIADDIVSHVMKNLK